MDGHPQAMHIAGDLLRPSAQCTSSFPPDSFTVRAYLRQPAQNGKTRDLKERTGTRNACTSGFAPHSHTLGASLRQTDATTPRPILSPPTLAVRSNRRDASCIPRPPLCLGAKAAPRAPLAAKRPFAPTYTSAPRSRLLSTSFSFRGASHCSDIRPTSASPRPSCRYTRVW